MIFALTVRLAPEFRRDVEAIRAIPVALPNSDPKTPTVYIRLGDLGEVKLVSGAAYIYRENSQRFIPLKYSVRDRDLGSTVTEAQERIGAKVPVPQGYSLEWSGEYGALVDAKKRLALIVPLSLLLILMLLYSLFNSIRDSLLALSGIPFAVAGGILGLYIGGLNFSVSAAVGFISLFGVSAMDGILLMSYIRRDIEEGMGTEDAIIHAAETRMRQIFMTGCRRASASSRRRSRPVSAHRCSSRWPGHCRWHAIIADLQPAGDPGAGAALDADDQEDRNCPGRWRRNTDLRLAIRHIASCCGREKSGHREFAG